MSDIIVFGQREINKPIKNIFDARILLQLPNLEKPAMILCKEAILEDLNKDGQFVIYLKDAYFHLNSVIQDALLQHGIPCPIPLTESTEVLSDAKVNMVYINCASKYKPQWENVLIYRSRVYYNGEWAELNIDEKIKRKSPDYQLEIPKKEYADSLKDVAYLEQTNEEIDLD